MKTIFFLLRCYSHIGRQGGRQEVSIGRGCEYKATTIHEMMHAIGFYHEQSRRDRDSFVTVNFHNIVKGMCVYGILYLLLDLFVLRCCIRYHSVVLLYCVVSDTSNNTRQSNRYQGSVALQLKKCFLQSKILRESVLVFFQSTGPSDSWIIKTLFVCATT